MTTVGITFEDKVTARDLNQWNALIASLLAGLGDLGQLNQVSVNLVMGRVAEFISRYFRARGLKPDVKPSANVQENLQQVVRFMDQQFSLAGQIDVLSSVKTLEIQVQGDTCRFCPKGVGEARLKGTLCPYPLLLQNVANIFLPKGQLVEVVKQDGQVLTKKEGLCRIRYQRTEKSWLRLP